LVLPVWHEQPCQDFQDKFQTFQEKIFLKELLLIQVKTYLDHSFTSVITMGFSEQVKGPLRSRNNILRHLYSLIWDLPIHFCRPKESKCEILTFTSKEPLIKATLKLVTRKIVAFYKSFRLSYRGTLKIKIVFFSFVDAMRFYFNSS